MGSLSYKNLNKTPSIIYFVIFIYLLMQNRCWIGFGENSLIMRFVLFGLLAVAGVVGFVRYQFKGKYIWYTFFVLVYLFYNNDILSLNIAGVIGLIVIASIILFVLSIPDGEKDKFLYRIVKWFGILMSLSLFLYFITLYIPLPSVGSLYADYGSKIIENRTYNNYIFYLKPTHTEVSFHRFNGPFLESGDVGCATAFLLFATKFNFKDYKYLWAVLLALVVSFSLAGYFLAIIGFLMTLWDDNKLRSGYLLGALFLLVSFYLFGVFYNAGDNLVNNLILSRLQGDEDTYIVGNNRVSLIEMEAFIEMWNDPKTALFGYNSYDLLHIRGERGSAGLASVALSVGLLGIIGLILPYLIITITAKNKRYGWCFFIFFILYFIQRSETMWLIYIISYVYGIVINDRKKLASL